MVFQDLCWYLTDLHRNPVGALTTHGYDPLHQDDKVAPRLLLAHKTLQRVTSIFNTKLRCKGRHFQNTKPPTRPTRREGSGPACKEEQSCVCAHYRLCIASNSSKQELELAHSSIKAPNNVNFVNR